MASDTPSSTPGGKDPQGPSALPVTLSRDALERVLARAAELQAGALEPNEGMTEGQLIALGHEVGIGPSEIRQALAEERTRVVVPDGGQRWFGPGVVVASRVIRGTPADLLGRLDQWMQREEALRSKRRFVDRVTWEGRTGVLASLQTGLNLSGRPYSLFGASEVGATVVAVDSDRCLVKLDADFSDRRRGSVALGASAAGVGTLGSAGLLAWSASIPGSSLLIAGLVAAGWTGAGVGLLALAARQQRRRMERALLALEQILDRLERGEAPKRPGSIAELINVISR
jgi:hypothetical protein